MKSFHNEFKDCGYLWRKNEEGKLIKLNALNPVSIDNVRVFLHGAPLDPVKRDKGVCQFSVNPYDLTNFVKNIAAWRSQFRDYAMLSEAQMKKLTV